MSEDPNASGSAAGGEDLLRETTTAEGGDTGGGEAAARAPLTELAGGDGDATPAAPADWPTDWREKMAGEDEAGMSILKRIPSVDALYKKLLAQEQTIRRGAHKTTPTLPDNATEEQVADYRKALGIPETPDGYGLKFSEDLKPTEADNALLEGFLADMHGRHMPPAYAKAAFDWYQEQMTRGRAEQAAAAQRQRYATRTALEREYGADFNRNLRLADEFLEAHPGLAPLVTPDSPPDVLREIIRLARDSADEEAVYGGDGMGGGKSLDEEKADLIQKSIAGKLTPKEDARLNQIYAAITSRDDRQRRGRAA